MCRPGSAGCLLPLASLASSDRRTVLDGDYYFASSVSFFEVTDRLGGVAQRVAGADDRCTLPTRARTPT